MLHLIKERCLYLRNGFSTTESPIATTFSVPHQAENCPVAEYNLSQLTLAGSLQDESGLLFHIRTMYNPLVLHSSYYFKAANNVHKFWDNISLQLR